MAGTGYGRPRLEKDTWIKAFGALHFLLMLAVSPSAACPATIAG